MLPLKMLKDNVACDNILVCSDDTGQARLGGDGQEASGGVHQEPQVLPWEEGLCRVEHTRLWGGLIHKGEKGAQWVIGVDLPTTKGLK